MKCIWSAELPFCPKRKNLHCGFVHVLMRRRRTGGRKSHKQHLRRKSQLPKTQQQYSLQGGKKLSSNIHYKGLGGRLHILVVIRERMSTLYGAVRGKYASLKVQVLAAWQQVFIPTRVLVHHHVSHYLVFSRHFVFLQRRLPSRQTFPVRTAYSVYLNCLLIRSRRPDLWSGMQQAFDTVATRQTAGKQNLCNSPRLAFDESYVVDSRIFSFHVRTLLYLSVYSSLRYLCVRARGCVSRGQGGRQMFYSSAIL